MDALNNAKIINAFGNIEKTVVENEPEATDGFIFDFLRAYGTSPVTLKHLQAGDEQWNIATVSGNLVVAKKRYFPSVSAEKSVSDKLDVVRALPALQPHKIRFELVADFTALAAYDSKEDDAFSFDFCDFKTSYVFSAQGRHVKAMTYAEHPEKVLS